MKPPWVPIVYALLGVNFLLGATALATGALDATRGTIVAGGIALTILAWLAIRTLPLPAGPSIRIQALLLAAQIVHSVGHLARLYFIFPNYDDVFHLAAVLGIGLVAYDLGRAWKLNVRIGPAWSTFAVFVVATATTGFWEIWEFATDRLLDIREQDDLADTMLDMVYGSIGAAVAAGYALRRERREEAAQRSATRGPRLPRYLRRLSQPNEPRE